jgi:hypothetical protein
MLIVSTSCIQNHSRIACRSRVNVFNLFRVISILDETLART